MRGSQSSLERPYRPESPHQIWRELCWIADSDQLAISGDLSPNPKMALEQLRNWEAAGITDVFDMRGEADDTDYIHSNSSVITSHWFGVDDWGTRRDPEWFDAFVSRAREVLTDPERKLMVHCHMGVNRGPSAMYAIMLDQGWDILGALRDIRNTRPIAGIIYAPDAVEWHARTAGCSDAEVREARQQVEDWLDRNRLDLGYVIHSIGNRHAR